MVSAAFKQVFLLVCLIAISGCRQTLTNAIPPSTEKPTLKIVANKAPQNSYSRTAPATNQEARIQIANVSPKELIDASREEVIARLGIGLVNSSRTTKFDLTVPKRQLRSRCCALR